MTPLKSDGTTTTTLPAPEERIAGEEMWLPLGGSAGMVVTERTALGLPSLLATVNTLATDVALLPLCVYQKAADGGRREAREHPADRLVRVSPDGQTTPLRWRQSWMLHALLHGNGYAEIQRTGRGTPYALHLLDPCTTRAKRVDDRPGYELDGGRWLEAANVLHLAGLGFDGLTGFNFVRLLRQAIGLGMGAESYAADYFQNGAEPGGVIETPQKLNPEGRANLRDGWHGRHGGPGRRHSVAVLEQGAKWVGTSSDPEKSQLNETRKYQLLDTIRPWRIPPNKAGDYSHAHLANIEASNLDYLMTALMGWVTGIEQECSFKLLTIAEQAAGFYIEANTNALLRGDTAQRNASYEVALRNGWMTRNEVRRRENLDPIGPDKGGDLFTVQSQNIPLDQVGKERPPKPPIAAQPPALRHNPHHGSDGKFSSGARSLAVGHGGVPDAIASKVEPRIGAVPPRPAVKPKDFALAQRRVDKSIHDGLEPAPADLKLVLAGQAHLASRDARAFEQHGFLTYRADTGIGHLSDYDFHLRDRSTEGIKILRAFGPDGKEVARPSRIPVPSDYRATKASFGNTKVVPAPGGLFDPGTPGAREARFNHSHGADGKFSSGGAGHSGLGGVFSSDRTIKAGGTEITPGDLAGHVASMQGAGAAGGHDWSVEVAKPGSAKEEAAVAKTEKAGKVLVRRITHEKVAEETHGEETHFLAGSHYAGGMRHEATVRPKKGKDATGYVADLGPAEPMAKKVAFAFEKDAIDHARAHVARKVARQANQDSEYKAVDDLGAHLAKEAKTFLPWGGLHASTHRTTWRVIAPDQ